MSKQVKRIGILTSGGDAPGMNAAVRAVVRTALSHGIECIGIRRGFNGLIANDFINMNSGTVSHIIGKGGTILYTARSEEFMTQEGQLKAVAMVHSVAHLRYPATAFQWLAFLPPSTMTSVVPTTPLVLILHVILPSNVLINCVTRCNPTNVVLW